MPHAPPCPPLACLEPHDLVSPWQAARAQRKGASPADDCAPPQAGLLLGGGACSQAVVRGQLGLGGGPSPLLIPTLTSPFKHSLLLSSSPGLKPPSLPLQAQRQLLHAELKLVLQQKGERKQEPGAQVTPSSAMEARSRSAEVSTQHILQGGLVGPWWEARTRVARRHFLASLCLSLPICEMERAAGPILWVTVKEKKINICNVLNTVPGTD